MTKLLTWLAVLGLLALGGCTQTPQTGVEPGTGPEATTEAPVEGDSPFDSGEATEEPTDEPTETGTANFHEKYVYEDGLEVEVTKITRGKVTGAQAEYAEAKKGDSYAIFSIRIRNKSKQTLDTYGFVTVTYGPDGEEAKQPYLTGVEENTIEGKLIPGKSKTGTYVYLIPAKYHGDVVLEFAPDGEHESAIFAGSIK